MANYWRRRFSLIAAGVAVSASLIPVGGASAHFAAGSAFERNRFGEICGSIRGVNGYNYSGRPCSINFTKSTLLTSYGWASAADAASGNWNGKVDPDQGIPVFGYAGYVSGPQQVYMGVTDLGTTAGGVRLGTTRYTTDCSSFCRLTGATIEMTNNSAANWSVNSTRFYVVPTGTMDWQSIATHELGHALALRHPQQDMNFEHNLGACAYRGTRTLEGAHDVEGVFFAYGGQSSRWPRVAPVDNCL